MVPAPSEMPCLCRRISRARFGTGLPQVRRKPFHLHRRHGTGHRLPGSGGAMREIVERKVLSENDRLAAELRQRYRDENILCVNLISSPGSGKTALLEKTLASLPQGSSVAVRTGDIQTDNDARRLSRYGFPVRQIVTGGTCHLDARMVERHLNEMGFRGPGILFVENVGNLVCPSSYDLGEAAKVRI